MIYSIIIVLHFIFDWILQPRHIARCKGMSEDGIRCVLTHMLINILPFSIILGIVLKYYDYTNTTILGILLINGTSHFLIDTLLPKGSTERQKINWTALNQILHIVILFTLLEL